ncbi:MAG: antiterminator LoaP [Spirochaetaceae bacterium]|jgi:transcriptional antiterminator NusG|nr:antiterminator LoaP [Spirochaetaceae bacterium]
MNYYALQVKTNGEEAFISEATRALSFRQREQRFFAPRRRLVIRRQGKKTEELKAVFPGYVFLETPQVDHTLYRLVRGVKGFFRFLKNNHDITPLSGPDLAIISHFQSFGGIAESSKAYFDENDRIVITEGPLQGFEGAIVKVDKRKQRVKLRLDFSQQKFTIDLAFEMIEKAEQRRAG